MRRLIFAAVAALVSLLVPAAAEAVDRAATPSTFSSVVAASANGDRVLLAAGSYGTWSGTNKSITVLPQTGATATMRVSFTTGDENFTLQGISGMGGSITNGARNITIRWSSFTSHLLIDGVCNGNILLDGNTHNNINSPSGSLNGRIALLYGSTCFSGVTVQNSLLQGGDSDGIHTGVALNVINNRFINICDDGPNHTDMFQFEGATGGVVRGNLFQAGSGCTTQGLTSYDGGTNGVVLEDNVVDIRRTWGIEWYADRDSIIRHNTVRWYPAGCYGSAVCGLIDINRKSVDPAGSGTQVYDNVAIVDVNNGSTTARNDHNVSGQLVSYVGPLDTWAGFALASGSAGKGAASDGLDVGIRTGAAPPPPDPTPTPTPTPTPSPTPTPPPDQPADAVWTAPSSAVVGQPVTLDGTGSTGDAPLSCVWQFEDGSGGVVQTRSGCNIEFTFQVVGTKYVRLVVTDADGDTDNLLRSFTVSSAPAPTPTPTPTPEPTPEPTPDPCA